MASHPSAARLATLLARTSLHHLLPIRRSSVGTVVDLIIQMTVPSQDQARVDKARRAFRTKKGPRRNHDKPLCKTSPDGRLLLRNENGACVLDSKKMKTLQANYVKASLKVQEPQVQDAAAVEQQTGIPADSMSKVYSGSQSPNTSALKRSKSEQRNLSS